MEKDLFYKFTMRTPIIMNFRNMFFWLPYDKTLQIKAKTWSSIITDASMITRHIVTSMFYIKATKIVEKKNRLKKIIRNIIIFLDILPFLDSTNKIFEETHSYRLALKFKQQVWSKPISQLKEISNIKILLDSLLLTIK
jgi:hypothetical protein